MLPRKEPDKTIAWNKLKEHYKEIKDKKMINFFMMIMEPKLKTIIL